MSSALIYLLALRCRIDEERAQAARQAEACHEAARDAQAAGGALAARGGPCQGQGESKVQAVEGAGHAPVPNPHDREMGGKG